jgi:hypothetical protein
VKVKFKKVAKRYAGPAGSWNNVFKRVLVDGKWVYRPRLDRSREFDRLRAIEDNGLRMAHHPRHDCEMCRLGSKELKHRRERELARKSPEIDDDE